MPELEVPKPKQFNFKTLLAIVGIIIAVLLVWYLVSSKKGEKPGSDQPKEQVITTEEPEIIRQGASQVAATFPAGFPFESGFEATDSYKYIPANSSEQQSTVEYVSKKSLNENAKVFTNYLTESGFRILNKDERESYRFYYATKDSNDLSIKLVEKAGKVTVSVSYLKR